MLKLNLSEIFRQQVVEARPKYSYFISLKWLCWVSVHWVLCLFISVYCMSPLVYFCLLHEFMSFCLSHVFPMLQLLLYLQHCLAVESGSNLASGNSTSAVASFRWTHLPGPPQGPSAGRSGWIIRLWLCQVIYSLLTSRVVGPNVSDLSLSHLPSSSVSSSYFIHALVLVGTTLLH